MAVGADREKEVGAKVCSICPIADILYRDKTDHRGQKIDNLVPMVAIPRPYCGDSRRGRSLAGDRAAYFRRVASPCPDCRAHDRGGDTGRRGNALLTPGNGPDGRRRLFGPAVRVHARRPGRVTAIRRSRPRVAQGLRSTAGCAVAASNDSGPRPSPRLIVSVARAPAPALRPALSQPMPVQPAPTT